VRAAFLPELKPIDLRIVAVAMPLPKRPEAHRSEKVSMSILGTIDALFPKDKQSKQIASGLGYGPDRQQRLDVYGPVVVPDQPLPVVVFFYGGGWQTGDRREYAFAGRALAALGYVVVVADYRLVPDVSYPAFLHDCADVVDWVVANIAAHGGDPARLALAGHSSGAYNAAMIVLDPEYLAARGRLGAIRSVVGLSGPYDFYPFDVAITRRVFGAVRDGKTTQPVNFVTPAAPPMLLATGLRDRLVYPRNTITLAERLKAAGVVVVEHYYAHAGHPAPLLALGRPLRQLFPVYAHIAQFLEQTLGASPSGIANSGATEAPATQCLGGPQ
jgi:acetyl esterase/lipase